MIRVASKLFPEATFVNTQSAQETLDLLNQQPDRWPQLVLLDIDLHQSVNGLDLLPHLQNQFQGQVPIVMLTTSNTVADRQLALDRGAAGFTQKPDGLQEWKDYVVALKVNWYPMS